MALPDIDGAARRRARKGRQHANARKNTLMAALVFVLFAGYVTIACLVGGAAANKGRSFWAWFFIAVLVSPVLAGIIVAAMAPTDRPQSQDLRPCPRCAEPIRQAARACRFCGLELAQPSGGG